MAGPSSPPYPSPPSRQGLMGHRPSISHGETHPHPPVIPRDTVPHPPISPPIGVRRQSEGFSSPLDRRRVSYTPVLQPTNSQVHDVDPQDTFHGFRGRKASLPHSNSRRFSTGWEDMEIVKGIHTGTLANDYFENLQIKKQRRQSVAVPTYSYLSKDFDKDNGSLLPHDVEAQGPSSKRRGINAEIRRQEAQWRHHQKLSSISSRCRQHFKKVEEVKLNTDESDKKEMDRIVAATKKLYK